MLKKNENFESEIKLLKDNYDKLKLENEQFKIENNKLKLENAKLDENYQKTNIWFKSILGVDALIGLTYSSKIIYHLISKK